MVFVRHLLMKTRSILAPRGLRLQIPQRYAVLLFAATCFVTSAHAEPGGQPGVRSINLVRQDKADMAVYSVVLDKRFDTADLDSLSRRIRQKAPKTKMILISFFLRGMTTQRGAWATSAFNPELDGFVVRINETTTTANPPDADLRIAAGQ